MVTKKQREALKTWRALTLTVSKLCLATEVFSIGSVYLFLDLLGSRWTMLLYKKIPKLPNN
jgi:hypothetical protein